MATCARCRSKAVGEEPDRHVDAPTGRGQPCVHIRGYDRLAIVHSSSAATDLRGRPLPFFGAASSAPSDGLTDLGRPRPFFTRASTSSSASVATDLRGRPLAFFGATSTSASSSASAAGADFFGRPRPFFGVASSVLAAEAFLPFLAAGFSASSSSAVSVLAGRPRFLPVGFFSSPSSSSA
jgi:hypothetical protein